MAASASPDGTIPEQVGNAANSAAQDCILAGPQDRPCPCRGARRVHQALRVTQIRPSCGSTGSGVDTLWRRQETVRLRFLVAPCPYPVDGRGLPPRRCVAPGRNRAFGVSTMARSEDFETLDTGLGFWVAELDRVHLKEGQKYRLHHSLAGGWLDRRLLSH